MKSNFAVKNAKNTESTSYTNVPGAINTHHESMETSLVHVFDVTGGETRGDHKSPTSIAFRKVVTNAGSRVLHRHSVWNTMTDNRPEGGIVWNQGSKIDTATGPRPGAASLRPDTGVPAQFGWGDPGVNRSYVRDEALSDLFSELRKGPNLILDLAEGGKTVSMVRDALRLRTTMKKFLKELVFPPPKRVRGRGVSAGQSRLDYATSKWLEFRYGWMPTASSIYDTFDQLNREIRSQIIVCRGRSTISTKKKYVQDMGFDPSLYVQAPAVGHQAVEWNYSDSTRCEFKVRFAPTGPQIWDWTSLNPLSIAWELVPLSFVADWIITMGDYLETMENSILFSRFFLDGYRTDTFKCDLTRQERLYATSQAPVHPNSVHVSSLAFVEDGQGFSISSKDRQKLTSLPFPEGIHFRVNLNAKRLLDAGALIHQLVARKFR